MFIHNNSLFELDGKALQPSEGVKHHFQTYLNYPKFLLNPFDAVTAYMRVRTGSRSPN